MTRIVTSHYRYKRPPRKRKPNPAALAMPRIVTAKKPKPGRPGNPPIRRQGEAAPSPNPTAPANDREPSRTAYTKSAIVTARKPGKRRYADVLEMTAEEYQRRGDLADAMFQEMKRQIAEKDRS